LHASDDFERFLGDLRKFRRFLLMTSVILDIRNTGDSFLSFASAGKIINYVVLILNVF